MAVKDDPNKGWKVIKGKYSAGNTISANQWFDYFKHLCNPQVEKSSIADEIQESIDDHYGFYESVLVVIQKN